MTNNPIENPPEKKLCGAPTTYDNFPIDLIHEILSNLPVKSVLRLRTVCKTWLSVISSSTFIDLHLRRSITRSQSDEIVIGRRCDLTPHTISLLHLNSRQLVVDLEPPYSKGDFPDFPVLPWLQLVGSCNGIVCVVVTNCKRKIHWACEKFSNHRIYLWNPATKHSKLIAPHTIKRKRMWTPVSYGFGFDSITNDFKVVRIVSTLGTHSCKVYSANKNSWKEVECEIRGKPDYPVFDALVKGVLYSIWSGGVLRFDLNMELFNYDITFPPSMTKSKYGDKVIEYKDSIAVLTCSKLLDGEISLWKVDDASLSGGSKGSWTQVFKCNFALGLSWSHGYLNSGQILFKDNRYLWSLYDVNKKETKEVPVRFSEDGTFKYMESLVSIRGSKQVKWKQG